MSYYDIVFGPDQPPQNQACIAPPPSHYNPRTHYKPYAPSRSQSHSQHIYPSAGFPTHYAPRPTAFAGPPSTNRYMKNGEIQQNVYPAPSRSRSTVLDPYEHAPSWDSRPRVDNVSWNWGMIIPVLPILRYGQRVTVRSLLPDKTWSNWEQGVVKQDYIQDSFVGVTWEMYLVSTRSGDRIVTPFLGELHDLHTPVGGIPGRTSPRQFASVSAKLERNFKTVYVPVRFASRRTGRKARVWCPGVVTSSLRDIKITVKLTSEAYEGLTQSALVPSRTYTERWYLPYNASATQQLKDIGEVIGPGSIFS